MVHLQRDTPKFNVFWAISLRKVFGPFFYAKSTVTGVSYLDVVQQWLFPQLHEAKPENFIWQQDGAPPHCHAFVRDWLNNVVPDTWIGRKGPDDRACFAWPPRSPDLTPCDCYLRGFVKDRVYVPPLPADLTDLRHRIEAAVATVIPDTLSKVWDDLGYRLDVCQVTKSAHIEHL